MKSAEIQNLLSSLNEMTLMDQHAVAILQRLRTDAMGTKGGVQRLVQLSCVPCVLKLLSRYVFSEEIETAEIKAVNDKTTTTALSIVANLLVNKEAKQQVKRHDVETLVSLLIDSSNEEIQVRCCRSLANLATDVTLLQVIRQTRAVAALIAALEIKFVEANKLQEQQSSLAEAEKVSKDTTDVDLKGKLPSFSLVEAACRVLRLIMQDRKIHMQLIDSRVIASLALLMKIEEKSILRCVVRTLSDFWKKANKRIGEKMAREMSQAGVMEMLMELVDEDDDQLSQQAFTILLALTTFPCSAALIGASSGVQFFISHLNSTKRHLLHTDVISGLGQLAREAVNRAKIRESDGLKVFIEALQNDSYQGVQDHVISSLVNFLYDDASMDAMVENGLVTILLTHLQRYAGFTTYCSGRFYNSAEMLFQSLANETSDVKSLVMHDGSDRKVSLTNTQTNSQYEIGGSFEGSDAVVEPQIIGTVNKKMNADELCSKELVSIKTCPTEGILNKEKGVVDRSSQGNQDEKNEKVLQSSRQTYSMHSPTYELEIHRRMEDYNPGVTRKTYSTYPSPCNMTVYSEDNHSSSITPYSPLSISSCAFSPLQAPLSSSASNPYSFNEPSSYSTSPCDNPDMCTVSPSTSPFHRSPEREQSVSPPPTNLKKYFYHTLEFSSSEEENFADENSESVKSERDEVDTKAGERTMPLSWSAHRDDDFIMEDYEKLKNPAFHGSSEQAVDNSGRNHVQKHTHCTISKHMLSPDRDDNQLSVRNCKRFLNDGKVQLKDKQRKHRSDSGKFSSATQTNILILLSSLSVRKDPSKHLATFKVISCLTNYLAFAAEPSNLCVRILSRILSNPHCLAPLLMMCVPAILVKTLMVDAECVLILPDEMLNTQDWPLDAPILNASSYSSVKEQKNVARSMSADAELSVPEASTSKSICKRKGEKEMQSSHVIKAHSVLKQSLAKIANGLLEDLSNQSISPYGEGVVSNALYCSSSPNQLLVAASLLFLLKNWTQERQRKFLFEAGALKQVLSALLIRHVESTAIKNILVLGLVFLARSLPITAYYQHKDIQSHLGKAVKMMRVDSSFQFHSSESENNDDRERNWCVYSRIDKDLRITVRGSQSCGRLLARREILIRNSSVFAAMFQGSYLESTQSEVCVSDTSLEAMEWFLHCLHGCDQQCPVVNVLNISNAEVKDVQGKRSEPAGHIEAKGKLKHIMSMITLADRFLLADLVQYLCAVVSTFVLDSCCVEDLLCFALSHNLSHLAEDCLYKLLLSSKPVTEIANFFISLAEGVFGLEIKTIIISLLKKGVVNVP